MCYKVYSPYMISEFRISKAINYRINVYAYLFLYEGLCASCYVHILVRKRLYRSHQTNMT